MEEDPLNVGDQSWWWWPVSCTGSGWSLALLSPTPPPNETPPAHSADLTLDAMHSSFLPRPSQVQGSSSQYRRSYFIPSFFTSRPKFCRRGQRQYEASHGWRLSTFSYTQCLLWLISLLQEVPKSQRRQAGFINAENFWPWNTFVNVALETWHWHHHTWHHTGTTLGTTTLALASQEFQTFHQNQTLRFIQTKHFLCRMIRPPFRLLWPGQLDKCL